MKSKWIALFSLIGCMVFTGMAGEILAAGGDFPTKPIKLYVGWGAGGGTSMMTRVVAQKAGEFLGRPVVVISKPGAAGTICNDFVRRAKPDGYTLTVATSANNGSALLIRKVQYTNDDFEYIGLFANNPMILFVSVDSPWKTLEGLVAYAKKHPGELKYTSAGVGTSADITMQMFAKAAGIKMVHVPMKSGTKMLSSVMGGHAQLASGWMTTVATARQGKRIRFLAAATPQRLKWFPNVPTYIEKGYPSVVFSPWYGVAGPKGMPKAVFDKLKDAFAKSFQDKETKKMLRKLGVNPDVKSAPEFNKFVHSEFERLHALYKEIGIPMVK